LRETRTRWRARIMTPHRPLLAAGVFLWAALARAERNPAPVLGFGLRTWSPQSTDEQGAAPHAQPVRLEPRRGGLPRPHGLFSLFDMTIVLASYDLRTKDRFAELESALFLDARVPPSLRFGGEPFERKTFDFQRRCLNPCPLGGWGTCALEARAVQDECEGIAGRTLVSSAARRAPMVREFMKLVGAKTTKLPTDVERGLKLSTALVQGGGTLGIEARW
jgi:hypothetical protein